MTNIINVELLIVALRKSLTKVILTLRSARHTLYKSFINSTSTTVALAIVLVVVLPTVYSYSN
jgi:type IV secretory pathway component VirB8